ncbi:bifunctional acetate--CoA ligase family protein/GNAT family N-acetyltransferase [Parachlamydia sp. C2]|uniref:bifunctional acetate--CoA ligase family protein/GNAT family N-acetyltransferase n=1 Tax=Candidatus Protochlamydia phocaeensis TaxID=1414722 RepID=UPI000837ED7F
MIEAVNNRTDPSQNFIDRYPQRLDPLFHPRTVAVIGAKDNPGSVGRTIMSNLLSASFKGRIYPVNPKRDQVLGLKAYPSVSAIPEPIDLAIIVTPAQTVPKIIAECVEVHVKTAIIISAGFKELGEPGLKLEEEILSHARRGGLSIIGPNCLGVMNPINGLNATFAKGMALPGNVAFISQSGAMCTAVLDWSLKERVGFSAFVSIGSMADVNWGTLIDYLGNDPYTRSLLLYMETIGDARSFMTAAREVALEKPIIVIKAGRSQAAAKAAASHTGSLAGSDEVFDAALERIGVLRVNTIAELFNIASVLSKQPLPKGPHLSIVTNAGGPAVLATDATVLNHAELTPLSMDTIETLNHFLPSAWSHSNPIDILGDANADRYAKTIEVLADDAQTDGILVILSPQDMTDSTGTAVALKQFSQNNQKPLLASWMGGESVREGIGILNSAQIPTFDYPDNAAKTFATMWRYSKNLQSLYETPLLSRHEGQFMPGYEQIQHVLNHVQKENRTLLTEFESKQILDFYHIPVVKTLIAKQADQAVELAAQIGYPVVLKLFSQTISHKTDVGGVKLNLETDEQVSRAFQEIYQAVIQKAGKEHFEGVTVQRMVKHAGYELILGSSTDPQFGPVLLFGMGGQLVEVFKDRALAIPPLNKNLARQLMQKTNIYEALLGVRGRNAIDLSHLEDILVRFSQMIVENRRIKECDINPLLASEKEIIALDARIVLHEPSIDEANLPKLAIRPYPVNYIVETRLKNGIPVILRPIRPEDEPLIVNFHRELSEHSVRQRYFEFMSLDQRVAHERLVRICFNDYDRQWALIAEISQEGEKQIIGVGSLSRVPGTPYAQVKLIIADAYHNLGLGTKMLKQLLYIAKQENIQAVDGHILSENQGMLKICRRLGFELSSEKDPFIVHVRWQNAEN